jgi:hypothetical protein
MVKIMQHQIDNSNTRVAEQLQPGDLVAALEPSCVETKKKGVKLFLCGVAKIRSAGDKFNSWNLVWQHRGKRQEIRKNQNSRKPWNGRLLCKIPDDLDVDRLICQIIEQEEHAVRWMFCSYNCPENGLQYLVTFEHDPVVLSKFVHHSLVDHLVKHYKDIPDASSLSKEYLEALCELFGPNGVPSTQQAIRRALGIKTADDLDNTEEEEEEAVEHSDCSEEVLPSQLDPLSSSTETEDCQDDHEEREAVEVDQEEREAETSSSREAVRVVSSTPSANKTPYGRGNADSLFARTCCFLGRFTGTQLKPFHVPKDNNCFYHACFVLIMAFDLESRYLTKAVPRHPCDLKKLLLEYVSSFLATSLQHPEAL